MVIRGNRLLLGALGLAVTLAAGSSSPGHGLGAPPAHETPRPASSRPRPRPRVLSRELAEEQARAASLRIVATIAAVGRVPDGVAVAAAIASTAETTEEGIVAVARAPSTPQVPAEPSCYCRATSAPLASSWTCDATVMRDVHHMLLLKLAVDERGPRLERIQSAIGGW